MNNTTMDYGRTADNPRRQHPYTTDMLGPRLRAYREGLGLSQYAFAEKAGLRETAYGHYETGRNIPRLVHLLALANTWGFSLEEVLR